MNLSDEIQFIAIYPPIGIARVGNADISDNDGFFLASEVIGKVAEDHEQYRNKHGDLKRQAVRFRVYATLTNGDIIELKHGGDINIEWRVQIANLKAGWYEFNQAMDLPNDLSKVSLKRNRNRVPSNQRQYLDITPSAKTISGTKVQGSGYSFDDGQFFNRFVPLGEVRTDEHGRLIFIPGQGKSAASRPGLRPLTFANNDLWHDDVCDGTIRATVSISGCTLEAKPGYIVVAPPNYGQGLYSVITMDDVVRDLFSKQKLLDFPSSVSFTTDIWPIFARMSDMSWTNHGIYMLNGTGSTIDGRNPQVTSKLNNKFAENTAWRRRVFELFRPAKREGIAMPQAIPPFYGDAFGEVENESILEGLEVTETMYAQLKLWAEGKFDDDWPGAEPSLPDFNDLDEKQQLNHLNRAGLHECIGGPFHPGIELTWVMRSPLLWESAYRLKILPETGEVAEQDFGMQLTSEVCSSENGPLDGVAPGSLSRWLGVPWQTDEASCNSDARYAPSLYLSFPSFWGARVPNQVLSKEAWERVRDTKSPVLQRYKHFSNREDWLRDINGRDYSERINNMVNEWWKLGVLAPELTTVEEQSLGLPSTVFIEAGRAKEYTGTNAKEKLIATVENIDQPSALTSGMSPQQPEEEFTPPLRTYKRGEV
ncbi:MAG: hypothetical protein GQ582_13790 [Methyloprofundus sp.]|nr:hypothetical protein [Methyloprofundus sp.]